jgi:hypothetical protein
MTFRNLLLWLTYFVCSAVLLSSGFHLTEQDEPVGANIAENSYRQTNILTGHEALAPEDTDSARFLFIGSIFELAYLTLRKSKRDIREWAMRLPVSRQETRRLSFLVFGLTSKRFIRY